MYVLSISTDSREQRKTLLFAAIMNVIGHHMWQLWAYRFAVAVPAGVLLRFQASCCGRSGCPVAVPGVLLRSQWVSCCGSRRPVAVTMGVLLRLQASCCGHSGCPVAAPGVSLRPQRACVAPRVAVWRPAGQFAAMFTGQLTS